MSAERPAEAQPDTGFETPPEAVVIEPGLQRACRQIERRCQGLCVGRVRSMLGLGGTPEQPIHLPHRNFDDVEVSIGRLPEDEAWEVRCNHPAGVSVEWLKAYLWPDPDASPDFPVRFSQFDGRLRTRDGAFRVGGRMVMVPELGFEWCFEKAYGSAGPYPQKSVELAHHPVEAIELLKELTQLVRRPAGR